jgi:hypothetical protein
MSLFQIKDNNVEPTAECLVIPEFAKIWDSDETTAKSKSRAAFAYIFHSVSPLSNYVNVPEREVEVRRDFLKSQAPNKMVVAGVTKFKLLTTTPEQRLLDAAFKAADKLAAYLETVDFTSVDAKGTLVHDPHKLVGTLKNIKEVMASLKALREMTEKGQEEKEGNRADAELNMFDENE